MRKSILLLLLLPSIIMAQIESRIEKSIKYKVAMMQNFVKQGEAGEQAFWQTKGKVTYAIVNYTEEQNPQFKQLFISQYRELLPIYQRMIVSEDARDTDLFVRTLIRQEDDYRNLLTTVQRQLYSAKLTELEQKDPTLADSYAALYFSDSLLAEYKAGFKYQQ
ncbi:MAG TPA: hypothetical protein VF676_00925 [Flavobacterium sp.]